MNLPSSHGHNAILIFVDRFTKLSHFVTCQKTTTAPKFAQLFVGTIIYLHGISESLVSDRGSVFTSHFWSHLSTILEINSKMSTTFHLQTDSQTERMNQTWLSSDPSRFRSWFLRSSRSSFKIGSIFRSLLRIGSKIERSRSLNFRFDSIRSELGLSSDRSICSKMQRENF